MNINSKVFHGRSSFPVKSIVWKQLYFSRILNRKFVKFLRDKFCLQIRFIQSCVKRNFFLVCSQKNYTRLFLVNRSYEQKHFCGILSNLYSCVFKWLHLSSILKIPDSLLITEMIKESGNSKNGKVRVSLSVFVDNLCYN